MSFNQQLEQDVGGECFRILHQLVPLKDRHLPGVVVTPGYYTQSQGDWVAHRIAYPGSSTSRRMVAVQMRGLSAGGRLKPSRSHRQAALERLHRRRVERLASEGR